MSYRPEREKRGYITVSFRDGSSERFARNEYESMCEALRRGDEWYEATDLYGEQSLLRLSMVFLVDDSSPAAVRAYDLAADEEHAYRQAHGED